MGDQRLDRYWPAAAKICALQEALVQAHLQPETLKKAQLSAGGEPGLPEEVLAAVAGKGLQMAPGPTTPGLQEFLNQDLESSLALLVAERPSAAEVWQALAFLPLGQLSTAPASASVKQQGPMKMPQALVFVEQQPSGLAMLRVSQQYQQPHVQAMQVLTLQTCWV